MSSSTHKQSSNSKTITVKAYVTSLAGSIGVKGNPDLKFNPEAWDMWCSFQKNKPAFHVPKENIKEAQKALLKHFNIAVEVVALSGKELAVQKQYKAEKEAKKSSTSKSTPAKSSTSGKLSDDEVAVMIKAGFTPQRLQQMGVI